MWVDASPECFRRPGAATKLGVPQVILNYAPVAREPWRLKAAIDHEGVAVSSRFLVFRDKVRGPSLRALGVAELTSGECLRLLLLRQA